MSRSLRAEDESGSFRRSARPRRPADRAAALRRALAHGGRSARASAPCAAVCSLSRRAATVAVACREAWSATSLEELEAKVEALRSAELEADRKARVEQTRLHARAVRQLMRYLRSAAAAGDGEGPFTGEAAP